MSHEINKQHNKYKDMMQSNDIFDVLVDYIFILCILLNGKLAKYIQHNPKM